MFSPFSQPRNCEMCPITTSYTHFTPLHRTSPFPLHTLPMKVETVLPKAYLDISVGETPCGRVVVELEAEKAPLATSHFLANLPRYKNTYFHRVIKNFMIQGGDVEYGRVEQYGDKRVGTGTDGSTFADENTSEPLDSPFRLCMANSGPNTNSTQFFVSTYPAPHLQGKHTVFGRVIHGKSVIRAVERVSTDTADIPVKEQLPVITECGEWNEGDAIPIFNASVDQVGGDIYEEYPDDDDHIVKDSSLSVYDAACIIKDSGGILFKQGQYQNALFKYAKALRYVMEYIPDEDQEPEFYAKYTELKKKLYLNISLVSLKLGDFRRCIDYGLYVLEMKLTPAEKAKVYYRMGSANIALKKYKEAIANLETAAELSSDAGIERELKRAQELQEAQVKRERAKYAKFFA